MSKEVDQWQSEIDEAQAQLNDDSLGRRERKKLEKLIKSNEKSIANYHKWMGRAEKMEAAGNKLQSTGKKMTKVGAHATGAVWTPVLYAGYQGVKHARKKPKNESIEQDLIELVKEVEQAEKQGKINEEQKREYIIDFVHNYYKA